LKSLSGMRSKIYQEVPDLCTLNSRIVRGLKMLSLVYNKHFCMDDQDIRTKLPQVLEER
jgi:hypothetical protein